MILVINVRPIAVINDAIYTNDHIWLCYIGMLLTFILIASSSLSFRSNKGVSRIVTLSNNSASFMLLPSKSLISFKRYLINLINYPFYVTVSLSVIIFISWCFSPNFPYNELMNILTHWAILALPYYLYFSLDSYI